MVSLSCLGNFVLRGGSIGADDGLRISSTGSLTFDGVSLAAPWIQLRASHVSFVNGVSLNANSLIISAVPEPGSPAMFLAGLLGLGVARRLREWRVDSGRGFFGWFNKKVTQGSHNCPVRPSGRGSCVGACERAGCPAPLLDPSMSFEDFVYPLLKTYMAAPQWVKATVGRGYSALPVRLRHGAAYRRFATELAVPAAGEQAGIGASKLATMLDWALRTVPAYADYRPLLAQGLAPAELLARLPLTGKEAIKAGLETFVSKHTRSRARLTMYTGGSTANPMRFYLEKNVTRSREYAFMADFRARAGIADGEVALALRGRTVPSAADVGGRLWMYDPIKRQLIFSSDHLDGRYMPRFREALLRFRPTYVEAFPSALYPLASWLADHPLPEFTARLKGVLLYSENVYDFQSQLFKTVFGCPVLRHYGHSERVLMAASMPDDERYFFWPQYGHFELVDAAGRPVTRPGELGEIVGTGFDNRVMPFVRYRTGDLAVFDERPHPALPGYPVCRRIEGRLQEFVVCRDHRLVSITTLGAAHFDELCAVEAIQYEQREPGRLLLLLQMPGDLPADFAAGVKRAFEAKMQGGCEVDVVGVRHIARTERGKLRMLVQHLDLSRYLAGETV